MDGSMDRYIDRYVCIYVPHGQAIALFRMHVEDRVDEEHHQK